MYSSMSHPPADEAVLKKYYWLQAAVFVALSRKGGERRKVDLRIPLWRITFSRPDKS